jgi:hypothetical protein
MGSLLLFIPLALARPEAPQVFCELYAETPTCVTGATPCTTCHALSGPPVHNPYGADVLAARTPFTELVDDLVQALLAVEGLDSDGDGPSNLEELVSGKEPGFDSSDARECGEQTDFDNAYFQVGVYDPAFAYKRVMLDFCGRSPRYEEVQAMAVASDPMTVLATTLDLCLRSPYWQEVLEELAVGVVQPAGPAVDLNILGNWEWDVRMFRYAMSGDRDAGMIMTSDTYVVVENGQLVEIDEPRGDIELYAQPLPAEYRFGLITTRYALAMRVMFTDVPRTLASHTYRELLGLDIARSEGLFPIDEANGAYDWAAPLDVDDKGVWQEECAGCHTTLDGLSYPWARYNGIDLESGTTGLWLEDRATDILPTTEGWIFGEPVDGPEQWVELAVNSDAFSENTVSMFWNYLFRRAPYNCDEAEFDALWSAFRDGGRNVEDMLRELITTDAYGVP